MLAERIQLWDHDERVSLHTYILDNSREFNDGRKRPAVIVCPGGAYLLTSDREAEQVAIRFAAQGYHAFVLRYSTRFANVDEWSRASLADFPDGGEEPALPKSLYDLAKAVLIIRDNAGKWYVDPDKIAVCGFSAGGHLAASLGVHWRGDLLKRKFGEDSGRFKPNALILGYAPTDLSLKEESETASVEYNKLQDLAHRAMFGTTEPSPEQLKANSPVRYVSADTPPTFIWHTADDRIVYVRHALAFSSALAEHRVPFELHVFESGPHGLSLCDESTASYEGQINPDCQAWVELAMRWLRKQFGK